MTAAVTNWQDGITFSGITATTPIVFNILGGRYAFYATAAGTTNVLSICMPDGTTYSPVQSETTSAFYVSLDLPPGTYEIVITTSTAVQGGVVRVPYRGP